MSYIFNADEIYEMAEKIERNGIIFYEEYATQTGHPGSKALLSDLASMEVEHEKTFAKLRKELIEKDTDIIQLAPEKEGIRYLWILADQHIFRNLTIKKLDTKSILETAIRAEKDSIILYTGLKTEMPESYGVDKIDEIIREELGHLKSLTQQLTELDSY